MLLPMPVSHQTTQKSDSQRKKGSVEKERGQHEADAFHQTHVEIHAKITELFQCPDYSQPDKMLLCWKDPTNQLCYPITEHNLNLWSMLCV